MKGKYIIVTSEFGTHPVLFSEGLKHKDLVEKERIVSAGFFEICPNDVDSLEIGCFGESETLHIRSRGYMDAVIIRSFMKSEDEKWTIMNKEE